MSQRNPKPQTINTDEAMSEADYQKQLARDSSPISQAILEARRSQVESGEPFLSEEEARYELDSARYGQKVADSVRENEMLRREKERLEREVERLERELETSRQMKDAA